MKLSKKIGIEGNKDKLPKFHADDTFRQKFVKYARWLGKSFPHSLSSSDGLSFCLNRLEVLLPMLLNFVQKDVSGHVGKIFSRAMSELDNDSIIAIKTILNRYSGATSYGKTVIFYNSETVRSGGEITIILPECSAVNDGGSYNVGTRSRNIRFMSIGYLILASELAERVISVCPEQAGEKTVFNWQNKYWDACPPVDIYDEVLRLLLDEEIASIVDFKKHVKSKKIPIECKDKKVQDLKMNQSTIFNQLGFRKVEVDTETYKGRKFNYKAFYQLESDFQYIYDKLPQPNVQAELRFRNLNGNSGVYYDSFNTIVIDLEHFSSFIHEYGHYVDYKHGKEKYSSKKDFSHIVSSYQESYVNELQKEDFWKYCYYKKNKEYYMSEVEIFARAFELWVSNTIISDTPLLQTKEYYKNEFCYKIFGGFVEEVIYYFNNLFGNGEIQAVANKPVQLTLF